MENVQKLRIENVMPLTNTRAGRGSKQETEDLALLLSLAEHRWIIFWIWKEAVCEI
jgi:hypothetical protein